VPTRPTASPAPYTDEETDVAAFSTANGAGVGQISTEMQGAAVLTGSGNKSSAGRLGGGSFMLLVLGLVAALQA
jgi:hypothetical protein